MKKLLPMSNRGIILAGHGVATSWTDRKTELLHMPLEDLRKVVHLFRDLGFDFLTMEAVVEIVRGHSRRRRPWVHLSFDDGYQNIFDVAYPFLKEQQVPFSLYVSTYYVESGDRFPTFWLRLAEELGVPLQQMFPKLALGDEPAQELFERELHFATPAAHDHVVQTVRSAILERHGIGILERYKNDAPMRLADLKTMASDPLVHIGSHSHKHVIFHADQNPGVAKKNVERSIMLLRDEWRVSERPTFCFPNGDWAPQWIRMLAKQGVPAAIPDVKGFVDASVDPMLLPRFWMTDTKRMLAVAALSVIGNRSMYLFGRKPPPRLASA